MGSLWRVDGSIMVDVEDKTELVQGVVQDLVQVVEVYLCLALGVGLYQKPSIPQVLGSDSMKRLIAVDAKVKDEFD